MARELIRDSGCMTLLKNLSRDEILEVLSHGLCDHCDEALRSRALRLLAKRDNKRASRDDYGTTWKSKKASDRRRDALDSNVSNMESLSLTYKIRLNGGGLNRRFPRIDDDELSEERQERTRFEQVGRKKDFFYTEEIDGKLVNVLQGIELYTEVFNSIEQREIVDHIFMLQRKGQNGQLRARTYSEPKKWMRGKGRVTIQFGCCYNYAVDKDGNPPGIVRAEEVDPLPSLFKQMIKRMVKWKVIPANCVPDSCIVNIYEKGDCIPPHIDHHDFVRPFSTVSLVSECNILLGKMLRVIGPGEFDGPVSIPLPVGSVLILNGNGADVAKHCIPGVESQRISITFRKMDHTKLPYMHVPDRDLMGIKPFMFFPKIPSERIYGHGYKRETDEEEIKVNSDHYEFPTLDDALKNGISRKKKKNYF